MLSVRQVLNQKNYDFTKMDAEEGFELGPPVLTDASILLHQPGWTLYEFDFPENRAIFVDIGPSGDVINVPFAYSAQMRLAKRWAAVDLDIFLKLSEEIRTPHRFLQFLNIGHCGSTLLHHVFNATGIVADISEPKFTRDIAMNRKSLLREKQIELAKAGLKFLTLFPYANACDVISVKHFSQGTKIFDIWHEADSTAKTIFIYRDAVSWCNSNYGFWQRWGMPAPMPLSERHFVWGTESGNEGNEYLDGLVDFDSEVLTFADLATCSWALHVEEFLHARQNGLNALAVRYNELVSDRLPTIQAIFDFCEIAPKDMKKVLQVFEADAHEGELTAHSKRVQDLATDDFLKILNILKKPRMGLSSDIMI